MQGLFILSKYKGADKNEEWRRWTIVQIKYIKALFAQYSSAFQVKHISS